MNQCKSCHAEILWARTAAGKNIPLDPEPTENGNLELHPQPNGIPLALHHSIRARGILYYVSHFATCPNSKQHRLR